MPKRYRRRSRRAATKRRRKYFRLSSVKGKKKASTGQRQSESYTIHHYDAVTITIPQAGNFTQIFNLYNVLFQANDFLNYRNMFDQFKLNTCKFSIIVYGVGSTPQTPIELHYVFDRTGFIAAADVDFPNITTYGSYKRSLMGTTNKLYGSLYIAATTLQEKSQYYSTDIAGVSPANQEVARVSANQITFWRSTLHPWNPSIGLCIRCPSLQIAGLCNVRISYEFNVTFRGARRMVQAVPVNIREDAFAQEQERIDQQREMLRQQEAMQQQINQALRFQQIASQQLQLGIIPGGQMIQVTKKTQSIPSFGSVLVDDLDEAGIALYQSVYQKVTSVLAAGFSSLFQNLCRYGLGNVDVVSNVLRVSGLSSFFLRSVLASRVLSRELRDETFDLTEYIRPYNNQMVLEDGFVNLIYPTYFYGQSSLNISCKMSYAFLTIDQDQFTDLMNETLMPNTTIASFSSNAITNYGPNFPNNYITIVQFPHANYWITGMILNYSGSTYAPWDQNTSGVKPKDFLCFDGYNYVNASQTSNVYYYRLALPDGYSENPNLVVSFGIDALVDGVTEVIPSSVINIPVNTIKGCGVLDGLSTHDKTKLQDISILYLSRDKLFN